MARILNSPTGKPVVVRPVWPNASVENWYRQRLQALIRDMSEDVLAHVRDAWKAADLDIGFASDAPPPGFPFSKDEVATGLIRRQSRVPPVLAAGIMFRSGTRILLLRRTDGEGWAFPAGGVEYGETPEMCARREAGEETGWGMGDPLTPADVRVTRGVRFSTFRVECAGFVPVLNHEHDKHGWFTMAEALEPTRHLHPGVRATLLGMQLASDAKPTGSAALRKALMKWGAIWRGKLDDLSLDLSTKFASKAFGATQISMAAAFKAAGFTVKFRPTPAAKNAFEAVVGENVNLIRSIPQQYLKDVETQVWQSVMKGSDLAQLSKGIQEKYGIAYRRAALIARDQNAKAKAVIENTRRKELGITKARWQHSSAGKVPRPTHVAMNGKTFELSVGFYDKDEKEFVWPGTLINCRCTSSAIILGFD